MIQFDRIENERLYLGFTERELDEILVLLEEYRPNDEVTNRLDILYMIFRRELQEGK